MEEIAQQQLPRCHRPHKPFHFRLMALDRLVPTHGVDCPPGRGLINTNCLSISPPFRQMGHPVGVTASNFLL